MHPIRIPALRSALLTLSLALAAGTALAQSSVAAIQGNADPTDTIIIQNLDTGFTREVKPNASGAYKLRNLPTGTFSVTVKHADGSIGISRTVTLRVGTTARVM